MKKVKVLIEETIVQEFEIEVEDNAEFNEVYDKTVKMYKEGKLVVDNGELEEARYCINYDDIEDAWCLI